MGSISSKHLLRECGRECASAAIANIFFLSDLGCCSSCGLNPNMAQELQHRWAGSLKANWDPVNFTLQHVGGRAGQPFTLHFPIMTYSGVETSVLHCRLCEVCVALSPTRCAKHGQAMPLKKALRATAPSLFSEVGAGPIGSFLE